MFSFWPMKSRAQTDLPRVLRFPVPLDKGNGGSGNEIRLFVLFNSSVFRVSFFSFSYLFAAVIERLLNLLPVESISFSTQLIKPTHH